MSSVVVGSAPRFPLPRRRFFASPPTSQRLFRLAGGGAAVERVQHAHRLQADLLVCAVLVLLATARRDEVLQRLGAVARLLGVAPGRGRPRGQALSRFRVRVRVGVRVTVGSGWGQGYGQGWGQGSGSGSGSG